MAVSWTDWSTDIVSASRASAICDEPVGIGSCVDSTGALLSELQPTATSDSAANTAAPLQVWRRMLPSEDSFGGSTGVAPLGVAVAS
jgi:hypothetical protein